ncbi:acyltransferase family protein [Pseudochrobactrum sp. HB0163]|uniref:acyltransferase family protein n=1 Tax=Pseudochrobactrum sp. HB0163 TaxID=3450708 RepID=UPI003F6DB6A1
MSSNSAVKPEKFNTIQILRGIAALLVVIGHTLQHALENPPAFLGVFGAFGVAVFFVISGFIISTITPYAFSPVTFIWRRVTRVVPLYWLCTLFLAFCAAYLPSLFKTTVFTRDYLLHSLGFIPALVPNTADDWRPLLKPGWTLNYEIFFYLLFVLFWWCETAFRRTLLLSAVLGAFIIGAFFTTRNSNITAFYFNFHLLPFLAGIWIAELQRRQLWNNVSVNSLPLLIFASALSLAILFSLDFPAVPLFVEHIVYLAAAVLLVITALCTERWMKHLSKRNLFMQIGDSSYSLYLTHMFVVGAGWAVFNKLGFNHDPYSWAFAGAALMIILASLIGAKISYLIIEKPFIRLGHKKFGKVRSPALHG